MVDDKGAPVTSEIPPATIGIYIWEMQLPEMEMKTLVMTWKQQ